MSTWRNSYNEFDEFQSDISGFCCNSSLLRWAIDMNMPVTGKVLAEACKYGVLADVKMICNSLDESVIIECQEGFCNAAYHGHIDILHYLHNDKCSLQEWNIDVCVAAVENGQEEILSWLLSLNAPPYGCDWNTLSMTMGAEQVDALKRFLSHTPSSGGAALC
jgi:hypothetical protein